MQEAKEKSETATETDEDRDSVRGTNQLQQSQRCLSSTCLQQLNGFYQEQEPSMSCSEMLWNKLRQNQWGDYNLISVS